MFSKTLLSLAVIGCACGSALATPLNLVLKPFPDIKSGNMSVIYNSTTHLLSVIGTAQTYEHDGFPPAETIFGAATFNLSATISNAGVASGGTLSISGSVPSLGITPSQTLLSGSSLVNFGFSTSGSGMLEFVFGSLGGALASAYTAQGPYAGVILNLGNATSFPNNFNSDWNNTGSTISSAADTGSVPAPASAMMLALGAGLVSRRRRR